MMRSGQGRHAAVTLLELGDGFSANALRDACHRFSAAHPLLGAKVSRGLPGTVPAWRLPLSPAEIDVQEQQVDTDAAALAEQLMDGRWRGLLRFDVLPTTRGPTILLMAWSHLLFDARGAEMALSEIAALASAPELRSPWRHSWGVPDSPVSGLLRRLRKVRVFVDRYYELRSRHVVSLGPPPSTASASRCRFVRFTKEETAAMKQRGEHLTAGIFVMPYFLAVAMRAHAAVLQARGVFDGALECAISAQCRKRGVRDPVWQNQVSQLFFSLPLSGTLNLSEAAGSLHEQFAAMTRNGCDSAFLIMVNWMRRMPPWLYQRFLRRTASGQITSFYHAHTGAFLAGLGDFCGGELLDGWHIPSVSQPPGTGIFFSECRGRLTASLCWREQVLSEEELRLMMASLRQDLLGEGMGLPPASAAG